MKKIIIMGLLLPLFAAAQTKENYTVLFEFNKYNLTAEAKAVLDSFIVVDNSGVSARSIELHGHCDIIGNDAYNDKLSRQRFLAVKNYLLSKGVAASTFVKEEGHGKRMLINDNVTDAERWVNRRVEMTVNRFAMKPVEEQPVTATVERKISEQLGDTATKAGSNLVLKNINFLGGMHQLTMVSYPILQDLLSAMKKNPKLVIEIQGHICCVVSTIDGYDMETKTNNLSEERAKAIWNYLITNGIDPKRVSYAGYAHKNPIYPFPEKSEEERMLNRRVEIRIISK